MRHPVVLAAVAFVAGVVAQACAPGAPTFQRGSISVDLARSRIFEVRLADGVRCYLYEGYAEAFSCVVVR